MPEQLQTDVLIVGAGPVGLALACFLRGHGVQCEVVDQEAGPTPVEQSRALGTHARTLEVLEGLGVTRSLLAQGRPLRAINLYSGGRRLSRLELDFEGLYTSYPFVLVLSQGLVEQQLIARLRELQGDVHWETRLTRIRQHDSQVSAEIVDPQQRTGIVQCQWLVGCDGAHSTVRHLLELSFAGTAYPEQFLLADVRLRWKLPQEDAQLLLTPDGLAPAIPMPEAGYWRLIDATGVVASDSPQTIAERFQQLLADSGFPDAQLDQPRWTSAFRIHRRTVDRLQVGRCLLAGDAAHIHSPVGGQGMNLGIQDAHNLAWKLAMVIDGSAAQELLDSYSAERLPLARQVLRATDWATRVVTLRNPLARVARNQFAAWLAKSRATRRALTRNISELAMDYRGSPIVGQHWRGRQSSATPRPGDRVGDMLLRKGPQEQQRLFQILEHTKHTILLFEGERPNRAWGGQATLDLLRASLGRFQCYYVDRFPGGELQEVIAALPRIPDPDGRLHQYFGAWAQSLYIIRPDGYVAYRASPATEQRLPAYLARLLHVGQR